MASAPYARIAAKLAGQQPSAVNPDGDVGQDPMGEAGEDRMTQMLEHLSQMPADLLVSLIGELASSDPGLLDKIDALMSGGGEEQQAA